MTDLITTIIYFIVAHAITTVALLRVHIILRQGFQNVCASTLNDGRLHAGMVWLWLIALGSGSCGALLIEHKVVIGVSSIPILY